MREPKLTDNDINQLLEFLNTLDYDTLRLVEQLAEAHAVALLQSRDGILNLLKNKITRHNQTLGELSEPRATPQPVTVRYAAPSSRPVLVPYCCPICNFATEPPHGEGRHKSQGRAKRPFTKPELKAMRLKLI